MKKLTFLSTLLVLALIFSQCATYNAASNNSNNPPPAWEKLGMRTVNMHADHDVVMVTAYEGAFTKVKFGVRKAPIHIHNIKIVFGNGESRNIVINRKFKAGSQSKVVDLPGNKRVIKKIVVNYKSVPVGNGKAIVVFWGRH